MGERNNRGKRISFCSYLGLKWEYFFSYTEFRYSLEADGVMKISRMIVLFPIFLSLCACALVESTGAGPGVKSSAPRVYYAGISGLKMFSECRVSGTPIAQLPLHEKVFRYKVERGLAYVKVARTGQVGWVKNANLVWQKRSPSKAVKSSPAEKQTEVDPEPTLDINSDVNHEPNSEIERRDASMFDAF